MSKTRHSMLALASAIDHLLNGAQPPAEYGFVLFVTRFDVASVNYTSNLEPGEARRLLEEVLAHWDQAAPTRVG
jgi:hypothetical protein